MLSQRFGPPFDQIKYVCVDKCCEIKNAIQSVIPGTFSTNNFYLITEIARR